MDKQWLKILENIKSQISPANFRTWFAQSKAVSFSDNQLVISVSSAFIKQQLTAKYNQVLDSAIKSGLGDRAIWELIVDASKDSSNKVSDDLELNFDSSPQYKTLDHGLNPKYNMENFVVGLSNNLAYAAAQAVIQNPGISYNPLFIYGGTGVGKTHLMQGIGNVLTAKNHYLKVIYCSSEKFTNDFIQSIQTKKTNEFRNKYRGCDLLLIDDIQFISGRDSTQEEFFHTFNELQSHNSQIVLTSDRPPHEMQKLEARLLSRFQGGLMVDIQQPDFDTRVAILRAKGQQRGEDIPEEVLTMIAELYSTNGRELEGKLIQLIQTAKLSGKPLTVQYVEQFFGKPEANLQKADYKKVVAQINQYFNIKMSDITGPRRKKELVLPRQLAMYLLHEECRLPYERIGQVLGGRDHTTILHGVDKIRTAVMRDREIQRMLIEIKQGIIG